MPHYTQERQTTLKRIIEERRSAKMQARDILVQIKLYEHKGQETGHGALHAALDDRFGASNRNDAQSESRHLIAREMLRTLLKRGHDTAQTNGLGGMTFNARLETIPEDDHLLHDLKRELQIREEKTLHAKHHRNARRKHLEHARPAKPHTDDEHAHHAHREAVRQHERKLAEHDNGHDHDHF
jgi:hypothetical protein